MIYCTLKVKLFKEIMLYKKEIEDKKGLNGISFQKARTLRIL
jgi:hypothetical protein